MFLRPTLQLSSHPCLGLPSGVIYPGFQPKFLHAFLMSRMRATCPSHLIFLDLITLIIYGGAHKLWSSSLCSLLQPPTTSSLLCLLVALFSDYLNLCSSFNSYRLYALNVLVVTWITPLTKKVVMCTKRWMTFLKQLALRPHTVMCSVLTQLHKYQPHSLVF